jgi:predicted RND superfamily exporter protein
MVDKKKKDIETRVQEIENLLTRVKIGLIIFGVCLTAFLGWQSYIEIPNVVSKALKGEAITLMNERAKQSLDEIKKHVDAANKVTDQLEKEKRKAEKIITSLDQKSLEGFKKKIVKLEEKVSGRFLNVKNQCDEEIKIIIKYKMPYGEERTFGWWIIPAKKEGFLSESDKKILLNSDDVYFYAETTKEPKKFWKGTVAYEFKGVTLAFKKAAIVINDDYYELPISCTD